MAIGVRDCGRTPPRATDAASPVGRCTPSAPTSSGFTPRELDVLAHRPARAAALSEATLEGAHRQARASVVALSAALDFASVLSLLSAWRRTSMSPRKSAATALARMKAPPARPAQTHPSRRPNAWTWRWGGDSCRKSALTCRSAPPRFVRGTRRARTERSAVIEKRLEDVPTHEP